MAAKRTGRRRAPCRAIRIITAVRDNMEGDHPSLRNFYRIVPGGMREDARAYADSFHEWNGLDAKGMPAWLLGADLVQTFNADNVNWFMQITVTVSRPCVFYVLADRRNPPPAWLRERFTDTGVNIACEYVDPQYKIFPAKGPGTRPHAPSLRRLEARSAQAGRSEARAAVFRAIPRCPRRSAQLMYGIAAKARPVAGFARPLPAHPQLQSRKGSIREDLHLDLRRYFLFHSRWGFSAAEPRETLLMNFGWKFHKGELPVNHWGKYATTGKYGKEPGIGLAYDDSNWRAIDLPHDFTR